MAAQAAIHASRCPLPIAAARNICRAFAELAWIPAFAGMTVRGWRAGEAANPECFRKSGHRFSAKKHDQTRVLPEKWAPVFR